MLNSLIQLQLGLQQLQLSLLLGEFGLLDRKPGL